MKQILRPGGIGMAQSEEHVIPDLRMVSPSPMLGIEVK